MVANVTDAPVVPPEAELSDEPIMGIDFGALTEDERTALEGSMEEFLSSTLLVQNSLFQTIQATVDSMAEKEI
ncbi:MAG: hypothetical protein AAFR17_09155 [Pseudomonadota bacterium]